MDGDDLALFERSLRAAVERRSSAELDHALDDLGWPDALRSDPQAAVSSLFALQGRAHATSDALTGVVADALGIDCDLDTGIVLPAAGRWAAPGRLEGRTLHVHGAALAAFASRSEALVVATAGDDVVAVTVPTASLPRRPVEGIDPWMGLQEIDARGLEATAVPQPVAEGWPAAVARAQLALAHELVGASRRMLELAREHALEREQFGRPIATFQAVRHRLADTLVAIETADALVDAAWLDGTARTAAMAKAVAGREARVASKHCQQVLAGIGFTAEHELHRHVRRVLVLDALFGTSKALTAALGAELAGSRRLPPLLPL
ncbi:acyl-CoA dehydrogenase family protein [Rhabdothermincola salaria]|uniref:acyl-CoA dehydrogenase family protein n=1 Tax=Rhabdothermincola salaria TaxID=2903142 RepID=UPI001E3A8BD8|nr:acyl-CoA dehydrogenase family protein [Rhabdothermincola salaria]MCD9624724.1 hypothetical protein [Rhabdothermincola salaria]